MKLSAALVRQTLSQFDARAIPVTHPAVPKLSELYGDHTFFLNDNGLSIIEPVDAKNGVTSTAKVVNLASWKDANQTSLAPHNPVSTSKVIVLVGGPGAGSPKSDHGAGDETATDRDEEAEDEDLFHKKASGADE